MSDQWWNQLRQDVLDCNLCTRCGSCVGVSGGTLAFKEDHGIVLPVRTGKPGEVPEASFRACPARVCRYPDLNRFVFGKLPGNWLSGVVEGSFVGHAADESVRRAGASGGVISAILIHLLETKQIVGAVCLQVGKSVPYRAEPVIARTKEEILRCAQSVYSVTPVNTILETLEKEEGPLAYVGLPDQVASIRKLQQMKHPAVRSIAFILGPYMGTQMTFDAIRSFLRSHGVSSEEEITRLKYRAGEWPGHLEITLRNGRVLTAEKFHYNYLIPFFITASSLQLVDFTNELTDISVGDAWSPKYESRRGGYSVVLARSPRATQVLKDMRARNLLTLEDVPLDEALAMHGHMLDFKKRGSFIRMRWMPVAPDYGYRPTSIPFTRVFIEWYLRVLFAVGKLRISRWAVECLPIGLIGPIFNGLRKTWKGMTKTTKRKGLRETTFEVCSSSPTLP